MLATPNNTENTSTKAIPSADQVTLLQQQNAELIAQVSDLKKQLDAFKKMLFGKRSEKRPFDIPEQGSLFDGYDDEEQESDKEQPEKIKISYERGKAKKARPDNCVTDEGLRFDDDVPVKRIRLTPPEIDGLDESQYEIIGVERRHKLAQQQASYTVLEYEIPQIKLKSDDRIVSAPAAPSVLERSLADVSLLAGVLTDKYAYHLPLYRQHQRIEAAGVTFCRARR